VNFFVKAMGISSRVDLRRLEDETWDFSDALLSVLHRWESSRIMKLREDVKAKQGAAVQPAEVSTTTLWRQGAGAGEGDSEAGC